MKEEKENQQEQKGTKNLSDDELLNATGGRTGQHHSGSKSDECTRLSTSECNSNPNCIVSEYWYGKSCTKR